LVNLVFLLHVRVMAAVWDSGVFQNMIRSSALDLGSLSVIMIVSVVVSQFISNVPLVAPLSPVLQSAGGSEQQW